MNLGSHWHRNICCSCIAISAKSESTLTFEVDDFKSSLQRVNVRSQVDVWIDKSRVLARSFLVDDAHFERATHNIDRNHTLDEESANPHWTTEVDR